jgi:poly(3-hydroxyalkanoate) synthetase
MSDKPSMFSSRSRWWTIDDHVEKDVPAIIRFVLAETHAKQVHFLGHSMVSKTHTYGDMRHTSTVGVHCVALAW